MHREIVIILAMVTLLSIMEATKEPFLCPESNCFSEECIHRERSGLCKYLANGILRLTEQNCGCCFLCTNRTIDLDRQSPIINLKDVKQKPLYFLNHPLPMQAVVPLNATPGTPVFKLQVREADTYDNIRYFIVRDTTDGLFEVDESSGEVRTLGNDTFVLGKEYVLYVKAKVRNNEDQHHASTGEEKLSIMGGERPPQFYKWTYEAFIPENQSKELGIIEVKAKSFADREIRYILRTQGRGVGTFNINPITGVVKLVKNLNYDGRKQQKTYWLIITAEEDSFRTSTELIIFITDVNDNAPRFELPSYEAYNIGEDVAIGTSILQVSVLDIDYGMNAEIVYSLDTDVFSIDNKGIIYSNKRLDADILNVYSFTALAMDRGDPPLTGNVSVLIYTKNTNDEPPNFSQDVYTACVYKNAGPNSLVTVVEASDKDGDNINFGFVGGETVSGMFQIDEKTGIIRLINSQIQWDKDKYDLNVTAEDDGACCREGFLTTHTSTALVQVLIGEVDDNKQLFKDCAIYDIQRRERTPNETQITKTLCARSFTVDYEKNSFLKDGHPFRYVSGSIHYFRVLPEFWHDRILKMKMAGLNTIQTYVEWNHHEPEPGVYNFEGNYDLVNFIKTAQDLDMLVILRTGPFIDAERDMGGLPYWLLRIDPNMKMRFYDPNFIKYIDQWYNVLLPKIEPLLYNNGGPIIGIQIENEYGFCGCDQYKSHLRDLFNNLLKKNVVLFTTDQPFPNSLACGKTYNVLATTDFGAGANVTLHFNLLRYTQADGPLVNSEYYPGYLDHWGHPHSTKTTESVVKTLNEMLVSNASVNFYMFLGGTSFGFTAGSNILDTFQACPTSYDYDAPLTEAGDPTPKYYAIRDTIGKFFPLPPGPVPQPAPKMNSSKITLKKVMSIWDYIDKLNNSVVSPYPLSFEKLYHPFGFVLYKSIVPFRPTDPVILNVKSIADRGYVYVNKVLQGVLSRELKVESIPIQVLKGQEIEILVENQGRVCAGAINDQKGIFQNVTLGSKILQNWTMIPVLLDPKSIQEIESSTEKAESISEPSFYTGENEIPSTVQIMDTFLNVDGWHKGVAFLNQFNLGRYWPIVGPQLTLYAPSVLFRKSPAANRITLLELEHSPCDNENNCIVQFVDTPVVDGPTPEH